jgi:hypothetical protein
MHLLHVNSEKEALHIDALINQGNHVFIIVYMEGCGPCNATRPEWQKMGALMQKQYKNDKDLVIIDVNKDFSNGIKLIGSIDGFPTMKYIGKKGKNIETYEDSSINKKDRSSDSFVNWIESKLLRGKIVSVTPYSSAHNVLHRISKRHKKHNKNSKKSHNKNSKKGQHNQKKRIKTRRRKTRSR